MVEEMILLLIMPINGGKMMLADAKDKLVTATIEAVALPVMVEVIDKVPVVVVIGNGDDIGNMLVMVKIVVVVLVIILVIRL